MQNALTLATLKNLLFSLQGILDFIFIIVWQCKPNNSNYDVIPCTNPGYAVEKLQSKSEHTDLFIRRSKFADETDCRVIFNWAFIIMLLVQCCWFYSLIPVL